MNERQKDPIRYWEEQTKITEKEGGKEKTQNGKLGLSKKRRKGENSTINEMNVRGKRVNVLVQVNRKSIVKTLSMGLICELDLAQAKGKRGERENETETRYCEDCTVKR